MTQKRTRVRSMRLVTKRHLYPQAEETPWIQAQSAAPAAAAAVPVKEEEPAKESAVLTTYEKKGRGVSSLLSLDSLLRNVAVVGALLLVIVALRSAGTPQSQSVFSAIRDGTSLEWDESLGKLSFVSSLIPESIQAVWGPQDTISVMAPCHGEVVHAWSPSEPYLEIQSTVSDVRAVANGEIMSVAHGMDEEVIIRLRHDDNTESYYGNLAACYMDVGDYVFQGDIIASVLENKPLAFELRVDGRSIDPEGKLQSLTD